jgi:hypothetical protein
MELELAAIVAFGAVGAGLSGVLGYLGRKLIKRSDSHMIEIKTPHGRLELPKREDMTDAEFERKVLEVIREVESDEDNRKEANR